jgi:cell division protein FtsB
MPRRSAPPSPEEPDAIDAPAGSSPDAEGQPEEAVPRAIPDLSTLPIAGLGRRQVATILGAILAVWIIAVFARQVGDASAASDRAQAMISSNEDLRREISAYKRELEFIQRQDYILQQARGYGLGKAKEIPFSMAADAPPLPEDAPGSAAVRVGADTDEPSPLDRWLELLFGPGG